MYYEREVTHHRPHFHAYAQDDSAVIALDPIEILESSIPARQEEMKERHEIHKVRDVKIVGPYALRLTYEDGKVNVVDLDGVLFGEIYEPLRNPELFRKVHVDPEVPTIVWPNGADFDPETLYYWDEYLPAWREAAEKWRNREKQTS